MTKQTETPTVTLPAISDQLRPAEAGSVQLVGYLNDKIEAGVAHHLTVLDYPKMVDYFRNRTNPFAAGEFWGKTVRSACLSYQYRADPKLKAILDATVQDLLSTQTPDGCISARTYPEQPKSSDLWERKYVLLGLESYYQLWPNPGVLQAMIRLADYTIGQIGLPPKTRIVDTGWAFLGIESSSILEPIMKLYGLTGYQRYLDFAKYIVEIEGGCQRGNIFLAQLQGVAPRDIGSNGNPKESIAKAYETTSCFEGLVEYYRVTANPQWKTAALNYYAAVLDQEIAIIGSGSGDQPYNKGAGQAEQWNHTAVEQTNPDMDRMLETCVTVTWMKFCYQLLRLTGDATIADQIEFSLYNALIGAQKPSGDYYDYYQRLNGTRNTFVAFTYDIGSFPLSCCTANGPSGMALAPFVQAMNSAQGPVLNLYHPGRITTKLPNGQVVTLEITGDYPRGGDVTIRLTSKQPQHFTLRLRIPKWSKQTRLQVNGQDMPATPGSYAAIERNWLPGDTVTLHLDMRCKLIPAPHGSNRAGDNFQALVRGPIVLSRDSRLGGNILQPVKIKTDAQGFVDLKPTRPIPSAQMQFTVPVLDGSSFDVIDYASAGNAWVATNSYCTWLPAKAE